MLRSLVGSEMCIRDRGRAAHHAVGNRTRSAEEGEGFRLPRAAGQPGEGCLLYTSDAADDLLCVDLGGRRIIKKKKSTL